MIVANLATYLARLRRLPTIVAALAPQVDLLNIALNEYAQIPAELPSSSNVRPLLLDVGYKDVGTFYPTTRTDDMVFLVDDDLMCPATT